MQPVLNIDYHLFKTTSSGTFLEVGSTHPESCAGDWGQAQAPQAWRALAAQGRLVGTCGARVSCTSRGNQGPEQRKSQGKPGRSSELLGVQGICLILTFMKAHTWTAVPGGDTRTPSSRRYLDALITGGAQDTTRQPSQLGTKIPV